MSIPSNLPLPPENSDSSNSVRNFFDTYFTATLSFPADQVDAVIGFFKKRGFDDLASRSTAMILLQQAKIDNVNIFQLLDTLTDLEGVQLSAVVAEVLNYNRQKNSVLGYKQVDTTEYFEKRNIVV